MRQYEVTYNDKTTEIVEAYGYKFSHGKAEFDLGHKSVRRMDNVRSVELVSE